MNKTTNTIAIPTEDIIRAYGEASELFERHRWFAINEQLLPYPKHIIKQAILQALKDETDDDVCFMLTQGYANLAAWRPMENMFIADSFSRDFSQLMHNDEKEHALDNLEHITRLMNTINAEAKDLETELKVSLAKAERAVERASIKASETPANIADTTSRHDEFSFRQIGLFFWLLLMLLLVMLIASGGLK